MSIVEDYERALAGDTPRRGRGFWLGWLLLVAAVIAIVAVIVGPR